MAFAQVNGIRLYYEEHGAGEPLLLVAGQGADHHSWDLVLDDFAGQYRCITWDHRGTGASDAPEGPYSIELFAADAMGLLDHLGIQRAHAYGVSMGGRICQRLAIDHGGRLGAVVLGCTTPGNAHGVRRPPDVDAQMANRPANRDALIAFLAGQMVSAEWFAANPEYQAAVERRIEQPLPPAIQRLHYEASEGHDAWDGLPAITRPVLVIHGDRDQVNPTANAYLLAGRIPGAELCIVRGGRHGYHLEFREQASSVVLDFLARHPL